MNQAVLSRWLKGIIVGMALCGLILYAWVIPQTGQELVRQFPEFSACYLPWLVFLRLTGIPCYAVLAIGWKISANIGANRSFSADNARLLKWIAYLAAGDAAFYLIVNLVFLFLNMLHPSLLLLLLLVVFCGASVSVVCAALSHLVAKAAVLQEQSDGTI